MATAMDRTASRAILLRVLEARTGEYYYQLWGKWYEGLSNDRRLAYQKTFPEPSPLGKMISTWQVGKTYGTFPLPAESPANKRPRRQW